MRKLRETETRKRGCLYCADRRSVGGYSICTYDKCPYHELDKVKTYGEYIQKTNKSGLALELEEVTKE